jgi:hypothetical protein
MYELRELIGDAWTPLVQAPTLENALDRLDEECRRRCDQLAANGEGSSQIRFRFEIRDPSGAVVTGVSTRPIADLPSHREIFEDHVRRARQRGFGWPDDHAE